MYVSLYRLLVVLWIIQISRVSGELLTIGIGLIAAGFLYLKPNFIADVQNVIDDIKNVFEEPCSARSIKSNPQNMKYDLKTKVFGQELAYSYIHGALKNHMSSNHNTKALAISLHGLPGTGKNHVVDIILKNIFPRYKDKGTSRFVHKFHSRIHFPNETKVDSYQHELKEWIISNVTACERAFFIFDEVDKFPKGLLNVLKPFLDHYASYKHVQFKNTVFIFLSNAGGSEIMKRFFELQRSGWILPGKSRMDLNLKHFENEIKLISYNDPGGFSMSDIIGDNVIDHYLPFLPLEKEHVLKCIESEYNFARQRTLMRVDFEPLQQYVMETMNFIPEPEKLFSSTGCKRVKAKVETYLARQNIYY